MDENAIVVKALIDRKHGKSASAINSLNELLAVDPLNHFARFEKYMITGAGADKDDFVKYIRQEMPHETFIEMAIRYYEWNMEEESLRILNLAPVHPMVQLWQAWLLDRAGKKSESDNKLMLAMAASPELVFPFRPEMTELFSWASRQKPDWKWSYYKALILWQNNQVEAAKSIFDSCGTQPDFVPFYLAKAELFRSDSLAARAALEKAYQLDPQQWRTGYRLAQYYISNNRWTAALEGKTDLVLHPFVETIRKQYEARNEIWKEKKDILPDFNLVQIKVPQLPALDAPCYPDWFSSLEAMRLKMNIVDFDIALIGAGAYSLPLAVHAKKLGKNGIHLGGATQIYFGIKGGRWDHHPVISKFYNTHWVRPLSQDTPNNREIVENGCYW